MYHDKVKSASIAGLETMAFSDRLLRLVTAADHGSPCFARTAGRSEALQALGAARASLTDLVSDEIADAALALNPEIFQLVDGHLAGKASKSFFAFLPLKPVGAAALVEGRFSGKAPDLSQICGLNEVPAAIYIWLLFAPGELTRSLRALAPLLGRIAPHGCPLFTRAATDHTVRLLPGMGFISARASYPNADADLFVLPSRSGLPDFPVPSASSPTITVRIARTMEDMLKCFSVRAATYMAEQECPFEEEFDGNDFCATHFLGEIDGEPAGCIRVRYFADFVKIERLAVRQEFRASRLAFRLVREAIGYCRRKGFARAYGHARHDLTRFWGMFGFKAIDGRPIFRFSDVDYVELAADLGRTGTRLAIGDDPYILIRPEGDWDRPGPLDRSRERTERAERIRQRLRSRPDVGAAAPTEGL